MVLRSGKKEPVDWGNQLIKELNAISEESKAWSVEMEEIVRRKGNAGYLGVEIGGGKGGVGRRRRDLVVVDLHLCVPFLEKN